MNTAHTMCLASTEAVKQRVINLKNRSEDIKARLAPVLKRLWNPVRSLMQVDDLTIFDELRLRFPNFNEVISDWENSAIGLSKLGLPFESTPILLCGEPGLGKTMFSSEAAKLMGLPYFEVSMATTTASFVLSGGNIQWSEGSPGFIASSLAESSVGNPFLLIDEIDKTSGNRYDPLNPLYPLLETHSATHFRDEALELDFDASHVIWVATANDKHHIPEPILSRMTCYDIKQPEREDMPLVIRSIYSNLLQNKLFGSLLSAELDPAAMASLIGHSPREARMALKNAGMLAIRQDRGQIRPEDIKAKESRGVRYGFI